MHPQTSQSAERLSRHQRRFHIHFTRLALPGSTWWSASFGISHRSSSAVASFVTSRNSSEPLATTSLGTMTNQSLHMDSQGLRNLGQGEAGTRQTRYCLICSLHYTGLVTLSLSMPTSARLRVHSREWRVPRAVLAVNTAATAVLTVRYWPCSKRLT